MARESFIFYASFYDAIKELPNELRLEIFDAVCAYALNGVEPELKGVAKAIFTLIKPPIAASVAKYENGCKGGAPKGNQNARKHNQTETEEQPTVNQDTTEKQPKNNRKQPYKDKDKDKDDDYSSPPISPPSGGEGDAKTAFFEKYPALKGKRVKDDGIDYTVLLAEFEQSAMLRGMYSFSKVAGMYESIKAGVYRDKVDERIASANAKSAREKWYADKRDRAERSALDYQELARKDARFVEIERRLAKMNLALAKAEIGGKTDEYEGLKAEQTELLNARLKVLDELGIYEWRLVPQYECKKCNDSGYLPSGKACDCYKGG